MVMCVHMSISSLMMYTIALLAATHTGAEWGNQVPVVIIVRAFGPSISFKKTKLMVVGRNV